MKLRPYQTKAVKAIRKLLDAGERPLCYAPTGAGKTEVAAKILANVRGLKVMVSHTNTLQEQNASRLSQHGVLSVTIQSLLMQPETFRQAEMVCWDECHHLQGQEWRKALEAFKPGCPMFGLSATPYATVLDELFSTRFTIARVEQLVKGGYILPVTIVRPTEMFLETLAARDRIDGALAYTNTHRGRQAIHFEPEVKDCEHALATYERLGVKAALVHGKVPKAQRGLSIDLFKARQIQVLISPAVLAEGFDAPCAEVLVAGRAFQSDVMLQQVVGRIRRTYPGKTQAFVLDCTDCCRDRSTDYFNKTDESLFSQVGGAEQEGERRAGVAGPRLSDPVNWVECPTDQWITEAAPSVAETLRRQENADLVRDLERTLADAKREQDRKWDRERARKRRQDPAKRGALLEAKRERARKRRQDPAKREAERERDRKRLQDPAKREAKRERDRKRRAAKKAAQLAA